MLKRIVTRFDINILNVRTIRAISKKKHDMNYTFLIQTAQCTHLGMVDCLLHLPIVHNGIHLF